MAKVPEGYIKRTSSTIPFGYKLSEIDGWLEPIEKELEILDKYCKFVIDKTYSLRQAAELITQETDRKFSHIALLKKLETQYPDYHPNKKGTAHKRKLNLKKKEKEIKAVKKKIAYQENKIKEEKKLLDKVTNKKASKVVSEEELEKTTPTLQEELQHANVVFSPNEGPQTFFLAAGEKDVLYGGAAGGGKSYAMLVDPLRYAHRKAHRALITHLPTEFSWNYLASRLRTTDPEIQTYLRCTANPGGVGSHWVKKRYIEPDEPNKSFIGKDGLTRKFIPANLNDNPYLSRDGIYEKMLESLPPIQRKQLLEGNWDVAEGAAFVEFDPEVHVIPPFEIPLPWERTKGIDYGYASESCCLWGTIDINDNTLIIYRELYKKGLTGDELASIITDMEIVDPFSVNGVLDTAAWANTGTTGPTVGESLLKAGHKLRRADKNRIQGKIQIHEYLKVRENGRPKLQIFNTCPNLIRELQGIPLSKTNPEDVDTNASDHAYDALRYMIMSRPRMENTLERLRGFKKDMFKPADSTFGY